MGIFDFIGTARNSIGKWQNDHGINTSLSRGYLTKQNQDYTDKLRGLVEPLIDAARRDQQGSIESNPDYVFGAQQSPAKSKSLADSIVNKNFAPQYGQSDNNSLLGDTNFAPQYNTGLADAVNNTSPITYQKGLSTPELMRKHSVAYSLAGVKPDALQMGMLSGDENYQAARMSNKLELTANEKAELARKYGVDRINALEKAGIIVNKSVETGSKYGTVDNNLTGITNEILSGLGMEGQLNMAQTPGLETMKTNAQVNRDNAAAESSKSTAWRNYNKPFYNPNGGVGRGGSGKLSKEEKWAETYELTQMIKDDETIREYENAADTGFITDQLQKAANEASARKNQYWRISSGGGYQPTDQQTYQGNSGESQDDSIAAQFIRQAKAEGWSKDQILEALHSKGIDDHDSYVW